MVMSRIDCRTHLLHVEEAVLIYLPPKRYDPLFQLLFRPTIASRGTLRQQASLSVSAPLTTTLGIINSGWRVSAALRAGSGKEHSVSVLIYTVVGLLALVGAVATLLVLLFFWKLRQKKKLMDREEVTAENAEWMGTTGLDEKTERELPRYLRREFGESLFDEGSLKAADLRYVGVFAEDGQQVHYWHVPYKDNDQIFAYIEVAPTGDICTGWGNREPPISPTSHPGSTPILHPR